MKEIMVVRPDWSDTACHWGSEQLKRKTIKYAEKSGWEVIDLYGVKANRKTIMETFRIVHFADILGHGNNTTYTANRLEKVFWVTDEETKKLCEEGSLMSASFLSCRIADQLLPWMIKNGLRAALGYDDDFTFAINRGNFPNNLAEPFFDAYCTAGYIVMDGQSIFQAYHARLQRWDYHIQRANPQIKPYLVHDKNADRILGDGDFVPANPEPPKPEKKWFKLVGSVHRESGIWDWMFKGEADLTGIVELEETEEPI